MKRSYEIWLGGTRRQNLLNAFTSESEAIAWYVKWQKKHPKAELRYYAPHGLKGELVSEGLSSIKEVA